MVEYAPISDLTYSRLTRVTLTNEIIYLENTPIVFLWWVTPSPPLFLVCQSAQHWMVRGGKD